MFLHCSNNGTYLKVYLGKYLKHSGLPRWHSGKEGACQCRRCKTLRFNPWVRKWQPTPVFLLGKFHGQRSLEDYSPWGCKESDITEHAHTHTHTQLAPWKLLVLSLTSLHLLFLLFLSGLNAILCICT